MGIKQANFVCILVSFSLVLCKSSSHPSSSYHEGFASAEPHAINAGRTISNINSSKNQTGSGSLVDGIRIAGGNGGRGGEKGGPTPTGVGGNGRSTPSSDDSRHAAGAANMHHHLGSSSRSQSHRWLGLAAAILVTLLFGHE